jgi:hypothetical protein
MKKLKAAYKLGKCSPSFSLETFNFLIAFYEHSFSRSYPFVAFQFSILTLYNLFQAPSSKYRFYYFIDLIKVFLPVCSTTVLHFSSSDQCSTFFVKFLLTYPPYNRAIWDFRSLGIFLTIKKYKFFSMFHSSLTWRHILKRSHSTIVVQLDFFSHLPSHFMPV